jgi:hypothetical protein
MDEYYTIHWDKLRALDDRAQLDVLARLGAHATAEAKAERARIVARTVLNLGSQRAAAAHLHMKTARLGQIWKDHEKMTLTYTAAICTDSSTVAGDYCDVSVAADELVGYREDDDGNATPQYAMGSTVVLEAIETGVRVDDDDKLEKAEKAAEKILEDQGWTVTGPWKASDNAMYAQVERNDN